MNSKGKHAEMLTELAHHLYNNQIKKSIKNYIWVANDGTKRETDVAILLKDNQKIAFEVRDRQSTQSIDWVDSVIGKYLNSEFDYVWLCTHNKCTLSKDAIKKLNFNKIGWRKITSSQLSNRINVAYFHIIEPNFEELSINLDSKLKDLKFYAKNTNDEEIIFSLKDIIKSQLQLLAPNLNPIMKTGILKNGFPIDCNLFANIDSKENILRYEIPFVINTYIDSFDEQFMFSDHYDGIETAKSSEILKTEYTTIFVKGETLCVNIAFDNIFKDKIMLPQFEVSIENIKQLTSKPLKNLQIININGNPNNVITRIDGIV